jgi:hypothetical protein
MTREEKWKMKRADQESKKDCKNGEIINIMANKYGNSSSGKY